MIGKNIAEIRKKRGYSLSELADQSKISKSYLSNIERNVYQNPSIQVLEKIAKVLNVDLLTLIKPEGEVDLDTHPFEEEEWIEFFKQIKSMGIEKEELEEYKMVFEFIKWKKENKTNTSKKTN